MDNYSLLDRYPHVRRLIIGYSGGLDSHVLLHDLATHRSRWPERGMEALYIDHGLQAASVSWGEHCAKVCRELGVPFRVLRVQARPPAGESPEAVARCARYAAFAAELDSSTALLTAHHRDDQAETLLLQLLRGAGPHGLAAMPAAARLGEGWLLRPLLEVERSELLAYAHRYDLRWIEDASNASLDFDRNYLRWRIMPLLRERWPAASRTLARSARWCAETAHGLDAEADADLARIAPPGLDCLPVSAVRELSEARQRNLLRRWLRRLQLPIPDARQLTQLLHDLLTAGPDRQPYGCWPGGELRRYRAALYAMPPFVGHDPDQTWVWRSDAGSWPPLKVGRVGWLRMQATVGAGLSAAALAGVTLTIRFRRGGERFRPAGRRHHQELKKLLQEAGIPPWRRDRLPLLYGEGVLLAVVGLDVAAESAAAPGEAGWQPVLEPPV